MEGVFKDGDAERVDTQPEPGKIWYIPHQGAYHPRKPDKIQVFLDSSAKFEGTSLNDHLLTGPDLTNGLTAVLCRFHKHPIAVMCDMEKVFHRFHVGKEDRDYLWFLWWENGDTNGETHRIPHESAPVWSIIIPRLRQLWHETPCQSK